jgi:TPR repeat protein
MTTQTHAMLSCAARLLVACSLTLAALAHAQPASPTSEQEQRQLQGYADYAAGNYALAYRQFMKAARDGIRAAQYNVAIMTLRGEVKPTPSKAENAQAIGWLRKSANANFPEAQYALGKLYETGELVPRDLRAAFGWYAKAAEQSHLDAQLEVLTAYLLGRGVNQDAALAASWAEKAAVAGDTGAQYLLAGFYERGEGVTADLSRALEWYTQAARSGDAAAAAQAREVARRMRDMQ